MPLAFSIFYNTLSNFILYLMITSLIVSSLIGSVVISSNNGFLGTIVSLLLSSSTVLSNRCCNCYELILSTQTSLIHLCISSLFLSPFLKIYRSTFKTHFTRYITNFGNRMRFLDNKWIMLRLNKITENILQNKVKTKYKNYS